MAPFNYGSVGLILVIYFFVVHVTLLSIFQTAQSGMEDLPDILCRNLPSGTKKSAKNLRRAGVKAGILNGHLPNTSQKRYCQLYRFGSRPV